MNKFVVTEAPILGVKVIQLCPIFDNRGSLTRLFCSDELSNIGWTKPVIQINHTFTSKRGTVRGLHYQLPPHQEMKLICCLKGAVLDIAVDVRAGSSTLLQWYGEELSEQNRKLILIPEGVAHGMQTLTDDVEMLYLHSTAFVPSAETGINPLDPSLAIKWDSEITEISARDDAHQFLNSTFGGIST